MSLNDYKKANPSEFYDAGNSLVGFSNDRAIVKAYDGKTIQQYGIRALNCQWETKVIKPIFHIAEAKGPILLGLPTLRWMELFQKHPKVFTEKIDIYQIQQNSLTRCVAGGGMSDDNNVNRQSFVSYTEQIDSEVNDIMDVTEEWVDTENIYSKFWMHRAPNIFIQTVT